MSVTLRVATRRSIGCLCRVHSRSDAATMLQRLFRSGVPRVTLRKATSVHEPNTARIATTVPRLRICWKRCRLPGIVFFREFWTTSQDTRSRWWLQDQAPTTNLWINDGGWLWGNEW